jgi:hypothetical protein
LFILIFPILTVNSAQRSRIDAARGEQKSQEAERQPPHLSELDEVSPMAPCDTARRTIWVSADLGIEVFLMLTITPAERDYTLAESERQEKQNVE